MWVAIKVLFGYYLSNFQTGGEIYGTYALLIVIVLWIYYTEAVFIIGAETGKLFDYRLKERIAVRHVKPESRPSIE
jgi:membrane protein